VLTHAYRLRPAEHCRDALDGRAQRIPRRGFDQIERILRQQHAAGRAITARVLELASDGASITDARRTELSSRLTDFVRMYRPHEAREDTVVFPAFHKLFTPREWDALGDRFEGQEREKVGEEGFEHAVVRVATIEHALGIDELSRFTPQV